MKSNYKALGQYIREVNNRNSDLKVDLLLGVSIQKKFIPSIANIIGTDMSTYKVIKKNQFAYGPVTSRNGNKISIALLKDYDEAIVSQAYKPFEVIDTTQLLPEYLMMWFRRPEFDRYARFMSHGSTRETFGWEEMCNTELPIPSIEKQKEIVKEYNVLVNRIKLNNQFIQKLDETAQVIYKQWFVEFEFSDENGKPYKSNGGIMKFDEELGKEIPKEWEVSSIGEIANVIDCLHTKKPKNVEINTGFIMLQINNILNYGLLDLSEIFWINESDYKKWISRIEISEGDCIITNVGKDAVARIPKGVKAALGRNMTGIRLKESFPYPAFLIQLLVSDSMRNEIEMKKDTGTILEALNVKNIPKLRFFKAPNNVMISFENIISTIRNKMEENQKQAKCLISIREIILTKMSKDVF